MLLIFDWDGTLADSETHIVHALQQASEALGLRPRAHRDCANLIGLGLADAVRKLHPQLQTDDVGLFCTAYSDRFRALENAGYALRLFDGVEVLLEKLLRDGHELAIATGKSRQGLDRALASAGLAHLFCATRTADESASKLDPTMLRDLLRRMNMQAEEAVMIGDTSYDMQMAQALGMRRVAATYGVHEEKLLQRFSPDWLIDKPPALLKWPLLQGLTL